MFRNKGFTNSQIMSLKKVAFKESCRHDYLFDESIYDSNRNWKRLEELYNKNIDAERISAGRIPKIIHQIWLGSPFPDGYRHWQKSWLKFNPGWDYMLWTDKEAESFDFKSKEIYQKTPNLGAKSDILRYFILQKFGGLYIDTDFECLTTFQEFHERFDFFTGLIYAKEPFMGNGIIGCKPQHPIINTLCDTISQPHQELTSGVMQFSGPGKFTATVFEKAFDPDLINIVFPVTYFYTFPSNKIHITSPRKKRKYYKAESVAVHHWEVSWTRTNLFKKLTYRVLRYIPTGIKNRIKSVLRINQEL